MKNIILAVISIIIPAVTAILCMGKLGNSNINQSAYVSLSAQTEIKQYNGIADKKLALEKFFEKFNSPLKPYAGVFVDVAEKYKMDYKLLPSISCIESSCGKRLIQGSNNPFGWGIYGNKVTTFSSYPEAIDTVGKGLKVNYISRGYDTVEKIAPIYTPPNYVNWRSSVNFFQNKISEIEQSL